VGRAVVKTVTGGSFARVGMALLDKAVVVARVAMTGAARAVLGIVTGGRSVRSVSGWRSRRISRW